MCVCCGSVMCECVCVCVVGVSYVNCVQVSNQCMALVRDDCLVPTLDAKELGYIIQSSPQQYVPDVFYKVCCLPTPAPPDPLGLSTLFRADQHKRIMLA